jgi:hypothetical protein
MFRGMKVEALQGDRHRSTDSAPMATMLIPARSSRSMKFSSDDMDPDCGRAAPGCPGRC